MGRYQLDKWYGLFWIYDVGYGTLRVGLPHHSGSQAGAGRSISSSQMRPGDLIFYTNSGGTINHVALYIGGGACAMHRMQGWYQDFHLELPYPGEDRQCTGRLIPWKVNKNYLKESREKRQLFPALFFLFHRKLCPMK